MNRGTAKFARKTAWLRGENKIEDMNKNTCTHTHTYIYIYDGEKYFRHTGVNTWTYGGNRWKGDVAESTGGGGLNSGPSDYKHRSTVGE